MDSIDRSFFFRRAHHTGLGIATTLKALARRRGRREGAREPIRGRVTEISQAAFVAVLSERQVGHRTGQLAVREITGDAGKRTNERTNGMSESEELQEEQEEYRLTGR